MSSDLFGLRREVWMSVEEAPIAMRFGQRTAHSLAVLLAAGGGTRLHSFLELRVRVWHRVSVAISREWNAMNSANVHCLTRAGSAALKWITSASAHYGLEALNRP
jgi:hypothetical protein